MFEVTREAKGDSGIGAEGDLYAGIGERLQIFLGHFEPCSVFGDIRIAAKLLRGLRTSRDLQGSGIESGLKERIVDPLDVIGVSKERFIAYQRRNKKDVA